MSDLNSLIEIVQEYQTTLDSFICKVNKSVEWMRQEVGIAFDAQDFSAALMKKTPF